MVKEGLKYNPLSPDVFYETSKVVGSNSTRLAGQVIVGVSAAFLVWDAIGESRKKINFCKTQNLREDWTQRFVFSAIIMWICFVNFFFFILSYCLRS